MKVVPNSSRDELVGWLGEALKVKLQVPPEDGKANKALKRLLSKVLEISEKRIIIEYGERSAEKLLRIEGTSLGEIKEILKLKFKK